MCVPQHTTHHSSPIVFPISNSNELGCCWIGTTYHHGLQVHTNHNGSHTQQGAIRMSTAWYKSRSIPRRVRSWTSVSPAAGGGGGGSGCVRRAGVEVWDTTCVVTNMASPYVSDCPVLINPANPRLSGVSAFPYFPRGGPEPATEFKPSKDAHPIMGYVSQWGGMEVGQGMMFPANVVDGLVHQLGGRQLQSACQERLRDLRIDRIEEGQALATPAVGNLATSTDFRYIVHTVPPFFDQTDNSLLAACYRNSLELASTLAQTALNTSGRRDVHGQGDSVLLDCDHNQVRVACPLLGAGCRGFPLQEAVDVAARSLVDWLLLCDQSLVHHPTKDETLPNGQTQRPARTSSRFPADGDIGNEAASNTSASVSVILALGIPSSETRGLVIDAINEEYDRRLSRRTDHDT